MDATNLNFLRETYRAEYRLRQKWLQKYPKYSQQQQQNFSETNPSLIEEEGDAPANHRRKKELKFQRDRTIKKFDLAETTKKSMTTTSFNDNLESSSSTDENSVQLERLNAQLSRFLGVYNPMMSKTQKASVSVQDHSELSSTAKVSDFGLEPATAEHRRKQHWLKIYFEESAKNANLLKIQNANKGTTDSKAAAAPAKK